MVDSPLAPSPEGAYVVCTFFIYYYHRFSPSNESNCCPIRYVLVAFSASLLLVQVAKRAAREEVKTRQAAREVETSTQAKIVADVPEGFEMVEVNGRKILRMK